MQAIIMAAGVGSRLGGIIKDRPKCLIMAGNETLLSRMVRILKQRGIDDIAIITGYKNGMIVDELGSQVQYFHNPLYSVTDSIASLWLAKDLLIEDVILMNADLYVEEGILDIALAQKQPAVMLSDCTRIEEADFRFKVDDDRIIKAGNQISDEETDCEYVGIARIDKCFINDFKARLEYMVQNVDFKNWWEGVLYSFIKEGIDIHHADVMGEFWTEIDNMQDYRRLEKWLSS